MRLTKKREDGQYLKATKSIDECMNKLGQLEDIEEELGIDLITLFKASKGVVVYNESKTAIQIDVIPTIDVFGKRLIVSTGDILKPYKTLYFKDIGKTWSLTKEELE